MKRREFIKFSTISFGIATTSLFASSGGHGTNITSNTELKAIAKKMYDNILEHNDYYSKQKGNEFFKHLVAAQTPRATIIGCSDSRFQIAALDSTPENDLFIIRNIGNQYCTNEGSVDYGILHIHTPLLIIVGHTRCGAIKAALNDYTTEDGTIRKELDSLSLSLRMAKLSGNEVEQWAQAVTSNVHQQVKYCSAKFHRQMESGELTIVGLVYDLANDFGNGAGKLHTININGERDREKLATHPFLHNII